VDIKLFIHMFIQNLISPYPYPQTTDAHPVS